MADQKQHAGHELRGGTEGGEVARVMGAGGLHEEGTLDLSPSGGSHVEPPAQAVSRTGLAERPLEEHRLAGGKTPEAILGYLRGVTFPAKKDTLVRAAGTNGAPPDVLGNLTTLPSTDYASADQLLREYPRLPDPDEVDPTKGST